MLQKVPLATSGDCSYETVDAVLSAWISSAGGQLKIYVFWDVTLSYYHSERRGPLSRRHCITSQKTRIFTSAAVSTSDLEDKQLLCSDITASGGVTFQLRVFVCLFGLYVTSVMLTGSVLNPYRTNVENRVSS